MIFQNFLNIPVRLDINSFYNIDIIGLWKIALLTQKELIFVCAHQSNSLPKVNQPRDTINTYIIRST